MRISGFSTAGAVVEGLASSSGHLAGTAEARQQEQRPPSSRRPDYLAANCVVLAAAVVATRAAYWAARELLPAARRMDFSGRGRRFHGVIRAARPGGLSLEG